MERIYRVSDGGQPFYAVERGGELRRAAFEAGHFGASYTTGDPIQGGLNAVRVLAPVRPSKMVCVGQNYLDHIAELKKTVPTEPVLFLKPPTTVLDPGRPIKLPPGVGRVDHEAALAVVIGRPAHRVPRAKAWDYIFGITGVNDVTARDIQNREVQYTRAKGFDTFAPIGPSILVGVDGHPRSVEGFINGEKRQSSTTAQLIFPIDLLVEYITFVMTLYRDAIVSAGTPSGVGPLHAGDIVTVRVEGLGDLTNPVENE